MATSQPDLSQDIWDGFLGHDKILEKMSLWACNDRFPQIVLLYGRQGLGKTYLARKAASLLFCIQQTACGQCEPCQFTRAGQNRDFLWVDSESESLKKSDADTIAQHLELCGEHNVSGSWRVVVLADIDRFTDQAANRLLKTLEESPKKSVVVMTTSRLNYVIPTILSRAFKILVAATKLIESQQVLEKMLAKQGHVVANDQIKESLTLCGFGIGEAFRFLTDKNQDRSMISDLLSKLLNSADCFERSQIAEILGKQKKIPVRILVREIEIILNRQYRHLLQDDCGAQEESKELSMPSFQLIKQRRLLLNRVRCRKFTKISQNSQLFLEALACLHDEKIQVGLIT